MLALKESHGAYQQIPAAAILALKDTCDQRAVAAAHVSCEHIEPAVLLMRLECRSAVGTDPFVQLEWLREQRPQGRSLADGYFTALAACHHRPTEAVYPCLQHIQAEALSSAPSHRRSVPETALGVMILRIRPPKWLYRSTAAEDDFPL